MNRRCTALATVTLLTVAACSGDSDHGDASPATTAADIPSTTAAVAATASPATTATPVTTAPSSTSPPLDPVHDVDLPPCDPGPSGAPLISPECDDPDIGAPYIEVDERRTTTDADSGVTVSYRYVQGGFDGSEVRFAYYFPDPADYQGRFFQSTYPTAGEEGATDTTVVFGISHGALVVSSNNAGGVASNPALGGHRANAAAAKFARQLATQIYGTDAPVRGYIYGASGGAYQTLGALENTQDVWDGGVPIVPGVPNAIPSFMTAQLYGSRMLGDALPDIVDALEPGGSGDPYAGLTPDEAAALEEVTRLGFPLRGWWEYETLTGGAFDVVAGGVRILDPTYADDFWSQAGYAGSQPAVQAERFHTNAVVAEVGNGTVTLAEPIRDGERPARLDLVVMDGAAEGQWARVDDIDGVDVSIDTTIDGLVPGDRVRLDDSWYLALEYYARHQVPSPDQYGWDQYRDDAGAPGPPQRDTLVGPVLAGTSGGGVATGAFNGKMIMVASALDVEAFPWSADWYRTKAAEALGGELDERFRVWMLDNAGHSPPRTELAEAYIVDYSGAVQQALLDLDAWVRDGDAPSVSTTFTVSADTQIELPDTAAERGGIQPPVTLTAAPGNVCADAAAGGPVAEVDAEQPVTLTATAAMPPDAGDIVRIEWDPHGDGAFEVGDECITLTYDDPGTYFAVVRVSAHREGDPDDPFRMVANLARVRIVVS